MAVLAIPEEIASRFAPYVRELHELFAMHGVSFGAPSDLPVLAARLDIPSHLAEDVSSILRSIILREGGVIPHAELIEILALAVAGPEIDTANPAIQPAFRKLLTFVGVVVRRPWNVPPGEDFLATVLPEAVPAPAPSAQTAPTAQTAQVLTFPSPTPSASSPTTAATPHLTSAPNPAPALSSSRWWVSPNASRVPSPSSSPTEPEPTVSAEPPSTPEPLHASSPAPEPPPPTPAPPPPTTPPQLTAERSPDPQTAPDPHTALDAHTAPDPDADTEAAFPPVPAHRHSTSIAPLWLGSLCAVGLAIGVAVYSHDSLTRSDTKPARGSESITLPDPVAASSLTPRRNSKTSASDSDAELIAPPTTTYPAPVARATPTPAPPPKPAAVPPAPKPTAATPRPAAPQAVPVDSDPALEAAAADAGSPRAPAPTRASSSTRSPLPTPASASGHNGPYFLASSGIMASHLIEAPEPGYPTLARLAHIQGQVILQAVISPQGDVVATRVLSGHRLLRGAAINAVKQWRYRPYVLDGHPVNVATIITVDFHSHK